MPTKTLKLTSTLRASLTKHFVFYLLALCRHPYELGGTAFSLSMLWAQVMPFVALQLYEKDDEEENSISKEDIKEFLLCILGGESRKGDDARN